MLLIDIDFVNFVYCWLLGCLGVLFVFLLVVFWLDSLEFGVGRVVGSLFVCFGCVGVWWGIFGYFCCVWLVFLDCVCVGNFGMLVVLVMFCCCCFV